MSTAITKPENTDKLIDVQPTMSDQDFLGLASSSKYFPRIQLFGSSSKLVKQGKFPTGHYGLVTKKDSADDLGESFDCIAVDVRAKAMDLGIDPPISVFNKDSEQFKELQERSKEQNSSCMWGPEFLVWLPNLKRFATMLFGNPTMRREAPNLYALRGHAATCKTQFIDHKVYGGWHGPVVVKCSTPLANMPTEEEINAALETFRNPTSTEVEPETAEEDESDRVR